MTPLPGALGGTQLIGWRLDQKKFASTWDSGEGAYRSGARWNSKGVYAVYCSIDPATAILEMAVHKGFNVLDTQPHILTRFEVTAPKNVHIVNPGDIPNSNWLVPGIPSAGQKNFGDTLLKQHAFILIPSVVSKHSWNLIFSASRAKGAYGGVQQEPLSIDTRLNPPQSASS